MKFVAKSLLFTVFSVCVLIVGTMSAKSADVTDEQILNDAQNPSEIVTYGLGPRAQRYSPLETINKESVKDLVPAWSFSFGGEKQRGQESQALVHDGIIYVTGSYSRIYAIDEMTGAEIWQYDARLPQGILPCCDVINRGAAIYGDLVYFGTLDARVVALNKKTGKVVWRKKLDDYKEGYSITAAPIIVDGKVIVTNAGGEFGVVGRVRALDAKTGEIVWERPTIEGHVGTVNGEPSTMTGTLNASWPGDMWKWGGGAPWNGVTYSPDTNLIFTGTGNPSPWNSHLRPGDNLYSASQLALNPDNGEIVWHYQNTPNEAWDYDSISEVIPFDYEVDGKTVKAVASAQKNGYFFILDQETGKPLNIFPFVEKITWADGYDEEGKPKWIPENRPGDPADSADGKKGSTVFVIPNFLGGKNWNPMAYSQDTGLFYIPANEWGMDMWNEPVSYKKGAAYLGSAFTIKPIFDDYIGALKAFDPKTGDIKWEYRNPSPLWAGVLATKGGLVFTGTPEGHLKALDADTGEELWSFQTGSGIVSSPVTWERDGVQYIGVTAGWGGAVPLWGGEVAKFVKYLNQGGSFWVFKLHAT
jgi:alcohol dehydrogenase (cytochrome c)